MSYITASYRPGRDGLMDIPRRKDGEPWEWCVVYSQQTMVAWVDDVEQMVAAILGDPGYLEMSEHDRLVARIKKAVHSQCTLQARLNQWAIQTGDWERCTQGERDLLNGPRYEQPRRWSVGSPWGDSYWSAPVPLALVSTGYFDGAVEDVPQAEPGGIWWLCPETAEDFIDSYQDWGLCNVYRIGD